MPPGTPPPRSWKQAAWAVLAPQLILTSPYLFVAATAGSQLGLLWALPLTFLAGPFCLVLALFGPHGLTAAARLLWLGLLLGIAVTVLAIWIQVLTTIPGRRIQTPLVWVWSLLWGLFGGCCGAACLIKLTAS